MIPVRVTTAQARRLTAIARGERRASTRKRKRITVADLTLERHVAKAVEDYLSFEIGPEGDAWFRMNSGAAFVPRTDPVEAPLTCQEFRRIRLAPKGTADYLVILPADQERGPSSRYAIPVWLETKRGKGGRYSQDQLRFRAEQERRGALWVGVRKLEDLISVLAPKGRR